MSIRPFIILLLAFCFLDVGLAEEKERVRVVVVGMTHGHVNGFLRREYQDQLEVVGFYESKPRVVKKYSDRYDIDSELFYSDLEVLLDETKPQAAWVFTSTFEHLRAVEECAPRGVHAIVEKPLAVDMESALRMAELSKAHGVHVLTNLETTWYRSLGEAYRIAVEEEQLGKITKIVGHFGHAGPIRVPPEFFEWLTDPVLNGGGASADFGCYGENIITWMLGNQRPLAVTAVFQTNKPETYPKVDDTATYVIEYPGVKGIVQASWDWTFPRKDVHIYGRSGILRTIDATRYDIRIKRREDPILVEAPDLPEPYGRSVAYYAAVIRGEIDAAGSLSSLENNLIATEIMEAGRESAKTGKRVLLPVEAPY